MTIKRNIKNTQHHSKKGNGQKQRVQSIKSKTRFLAVFREMRVNFVGCPLKTSSLSYYRSQV
jgi:hypothetical protein